MFRRKIWVKIYGENTEIWGHYHLAEEGEFWNVFCREKMVKNGDIII